MFTGPLVRRHRGQILAVDQQPAPSGNLEARQHSQQRGFAAAGRAEQTENLAALNPKGNVVDGKEIAKSLADVLELDVGLRRRVSGRS